MIVVDASALVAILLGEEDGPLLRETLIRTTTIRLSPIGYWEAAVRVRRFRGQAGVADLDRLIERLKIEVMPATAPTAKAAVDAEARFGKRTPANLNLGDCFAYAVARELNAPLLYKGGDFGQTDIEPALTL